MRSPIFHHEIESAVHRADHGLLVLKGWCLVDGDTQSPSVRLIVGDNPGFLPSSRFSRRDVLDTFNAPASVDPCGFVIEARIDPGAHVARLEACANDGSWQTLKRFIILATADLLQFGIEQPPPGTILDQSSRVLGWCAHRNHRLEELWLHYGTQRIRCNTGLPREDVPRFLPESPDANRAGFVSVKNLPVGRGPLRLKAVTEEREVLIRDTGTQVAITKDEDHARPFVLDEERPDLGPARRMPATDAASPDPLALRILFVLYGDFTSNSAIHVANLANQLCARGHSCIVAVPGNVETADYFRHRKFAAVDFDGARTLAASTSFDLIHAWTTRENVRAFCKQVTAAQSGARLVVHLEDNERHLLESSVGRSSAELAAMPETELDSLVPPTLSHPRRSREFLLSAHGITVILDALREHVPEGKDVCTIWPAADESYYFPRPRPMKFREALGWADDHIVLFYHGNVHASNRAEVRELYAAVLELNHQGFGCTLIRLGRDSCDFLGEMEPTIAPHVMNLGIIKNHHIPLLLSLADYFVQPGEPDAFNDFRLPSKLPEFFAIGRPVILPRTNLGLVVRHGTDAYVLDRANAAGIRDAVIDLQQNPGLRAKLSEGALAFSRKHFDWARSADRLYRHYQTVITAA